MYQKILFPHYYKSKNTLSTMLEITEQNKDHIAVIKKIKTIIKNFKNLNKELARIGK